MTAKTRSAKAAEARKTEGKPPRPAFGPEAHVDDGADLPADSGAGEPQPIADAPQGDDGGGAGDVDAGPADAVMEQWLDLRSLPEDEARRSFPRLIAVLKARSSAFECFRITSKRAGFRRAGIAHAGVGIDHPADTFTPAQVEQLLAEPMLVVELV